IRPVVANDHSPRTGEDQKRLISQLRGTLNATGMKFRGLRVDAVPCRPGSNPRIGATPNRRRESDPLPRTVISALGRKNQKKQRTRTGPLPSWRGARGSEARADADADRPRVEAHVALDRLPGQLRVGVAVQVARV